MVGAMEAKGLAVVRRSELVDRGDHRRISLDQYWSSYFRITSEPNQLRVRLQACSLEVGQES